MYFLLKMGGFSSQLCDRLPEGMFCFGFFWVISYLFFGSEKNHGFCQDPELELRLYTSWILVCKMFVKEMERSQCFFCQGIYAIKGSLKFVPPISICKVCREKICPKNTVLPLIFWVICWMKGKVCHQQIRFFFISFFFFGGGEGVVILHSLRPLSDVL